MPVTFVPNVFSEPQWHTVHLGEHASIEVAIALPTLEEQLKSLGESRGFSYQAYVLSASIKDWRGVVNEVGSSVPYSWNSLSQLCMTYPDAAFQLLAVHRKATEGLLEIERKNLSSPPVSGGGATVTETTVTIESSITGATFNG